MTEKNAKQLKRRKLSEVLRRQERRRTRRYLMIWQQKASRGMKAALYSLLALAESLPLLDGEELDDCVQRLGDGLDSFRVGFASLRDEYRDLTAPESDEAPIDAEFEDDGEPAGDRTSNPGAGVER